MPKPEADHEAENTKFDVKENAQQEKMRGAKEPMNPNKMNKTNEPNAGGPNRESGHRG